MHSMAYYYVAMHTTRSSLHNLVCIVDLLASMHTVLVVVRMHSLFILLYELVEYYGYSS